MVARHWDRVSGCRLRDEVSWRDATSDSVRYQRIPNEAALTVPSGKPAVERRDFEQRVQRTFYEDAGRLSDAVKAWQYQNSVKNGRNRQSSSEGRQLCNGIRIRCRPNSDWVLICDVVRSWATEVTVYKVYQWTITIIITVTTIEDRDKLETMIMWKVRA